MLLWAGFNAWFYLGGGKQSMVSPLVVYPHLWQPVEGQGQVVDDTMRLTAPDRMAWAMMAGQLLKALPARDFAAIQLRVLERSGVMEISAGLAAPGELAGFQAVPVSVGADGWVNVPIEEMFFRRDEIGYVVVRVRGGMDPAFEFDQVELVRDTPSFLALQGMIWRSLVNLDDWTQRSINHQIPDLSPLRIALVPAVLGWMLLSLLLYSAFTIRHWQWRALALPSVVLLLSGWLMMDLIWQVRLWVNHGRAVSLYWGKTPEEKRLAEFDSDVFALVQALKDELDDPTRRVLIFGDTAFAHFRARYFAVPHPVISRRGVSDSWIRRARSGDVLLMVHLPDAMQTESSELVTVNRDMMAGPIWPLSEMAGRDGEWVQLDDQEMLRMREGQRPWLLQSAWKALDAGLWSLALDLGAQDRDGWIRLEVLARPAAARRGGSRIAWREVYARSSVSGTVSVPFVLEPGQDVLVRVRELDALGTYATAVRILPKELGYGMVLLSTDGEPPYFLGRKLVETGAGVAYEVF